METCPGWRITSFLVGLQWAWSEGLRNTTGSAEIIDISPARRKGESLDLVTEQTSLHTMLGDQSSV